MVKVLVCGGRKYTNYPQVESVISAYHKLHTITLLIEGGAEGADAFGEQVAKKYNIPHHKEKALWQNFNSAIEPVKEYTTDSGWRCNCLAGTNRNKRMLEMNPDIVFAFHGGTGTQNMINISTKANIKVILADG